MIEPITVIIVDDETPARSRLRSLLANDSSLDIIGECKNGPEAIAAIRETKPDLVLLDVQMPTLDGFDVLLRLNESELPAVIFVTAYDQYALRAFDVNAVDFLLKPYDKERLSLAIQRARQRLKAKESSEAQSALQKLLTEIRQSRTDDSAPSFADRLAVKVDGAVIFVRTEEIEWIESAQNYVTLHCQKQTPMLRGSVKGLAEKLDPDKFVRVHRSTIVNIDSIRESTPWFHGDQRIMLHSGEKLILSRKRRDVLNRFFDGK